MSAFTGTGQMVRLAMRRDRVMMPVWVVVFAGIAAASASAGIDLYPTAASRIAVAQTSNATPALLALYGRIYDPADLGGIAMLKMTTMGATLVAVLMIITVVRHTRAEEESGRLELLSACVVGRHAPLSAAIIVAFGSSVLLGALTTVGLVGAGLAAAGSVAFGLTWACAGIVFGAIAAMTAQLTESARTATGSAVSVLAVAYVLRAIADSSTSGGAHWLSWLSPVGWATQIRPYGGNRWWVALVVVGFVVVAVATAYALRSRRDFAAGLVRPSLGRSRAPSTLRSPLALAWRLQRASLAVWLVGFVLLGFVAGAIAGDIGNLLDSPESKQLIEKLGGVSGLSDAFLSTEIGIMGVIAAAYGIQAAARLRSEETALRAEPLLALDVSRSRLLASHVVIALLGTTILMLGMGLGAGLAHGASTGDVGNAVGRLLVAAIAQLPAVWVLTAIVVAFFGLAPRLIVAGWVALVVFLTIGQFGSVLGLSQPVMDISPFAHTPRLPGGEFSLTPVLWLCAVALALLITGFAGFRRRDVG